MHQRNVIAILLLSFVSTGSCCLSGDPNNPFPTTTAATQTVVTESPTTESANTAQSPSDNCKAAACDFGKGSSCGYTNSEDQSGLKRFENRKGRIGNRDTGVTGPAVGSDNYQGVEINPGEKAILQSGPVQFDTPKTLQVRFFEATDGLMLMACSNDENHCSVLSNPGIKVTDKVWETNTWPIPPDTHKILLVGQNEATNYGALGIDKIDIVDGTLQPGVTGIGQCGI